jgi:hypothetical protein
MQECGDLISETNGTTSCSDECKKTLVKLMKIKDVGAKLKDVSRLANG